LKVPKLKVLVVTGTLAKTSVEEYVRRSKVEAEVLSLPMQVAALLSPRYVARKLAEKNWEGFDIILLPGMMEGDTAPVWKATGIPTYKGPKHAADLPLILDSLGKLPLSTSQPACELAQEAVAKKAAEELASLRMETRRLARREGSVTVGVGRGKVGTYLGGPPLLVAEIVNASALPKEAVARWARYYVESGADIVDVGMEAGGGRVEEARRAVKAAVKAVAKPVSIDSNDIDELRAGVEAGATMVLSLNETNMGEATSFARDLPVVVTPADERGRVAPHYGERIRRLEANLRKAKALGFKKVVADPILGLHPPFSFLDSLLAYVEFGRRNPGVPSFFGAGNVTELVDADSGGLNFLLALLGWELGVSFMFTTQASDKTWGAVQELSTALRMVALARRRGSPPKDLGLSLLRLKEKRRREEPLNHQEEQGAAMLRVPSEAKVARDPQGCFKLRVDRTRGELVALHFQPGATKPDTSIRGREPWQIYRAAVKAGLLSLLDHAAYLGCELQKAKIALKTGRSYLQDGEIFEWEGCG
jgi:dihydropteroate synthase-like protein